MTNTNPPPQSVSGRSGVEPLAPRPRKAVGPARPAYFGTGDVDRVMAIVLALASELAAVRERLDTHERLAGAGVLPGNGPVEGYRPDAQAEQAREAWRDAYIHRLFRVVTEDVEALRRGGVDPGATPP